MAKYTILGILDGVAITAAFKLFGLVPTDFFIIPFLVAAFFAGMMADYGQGVWAGFFSSFLFPAIWLSHLLEAPDLNGWLFVMGFFGGLGLAVGMAGGIVGIIGNVSGRRIFRYARVS